MNRGSNYFLIGAATVGILFMLVGMYDLVFLSAVDKSGFVIGLELVAGFCFLLSALLQWRKSR